MRQEISGPGVYDDMPDEVYHGDPTPEGSLSNSGAKHLIPPSTPAHFKHWRERGDKPKREFDFGHAAHSLVLGRGLQVHVVKADNWKKRAAQDERDAAYERGEAPLLEREWDAVQDMAQALREHPEAAALLDPARGKPEQSLFWRHDRTGVMLRCRLDLMPHAVPAGRRYILADYKTTTDASTDAFMRSAAEFGYHRQRAFYCAAVKALGIHPEPEFLFVAQERKPPYLVNVVQLDDEAERLGRIEMEQAVNIYARCVESGRWPGYSGVQLGTLPRWFTYGKDIA
jgi:hypothetical protein